MVEECSTVPQLLKFAISWLLLKEKLPREKNGNLSKPCYTRHWAKRIITKRKVFRLSSSRKHKRLKASYNRRNRSSNASGAESFCKCSALTQEDQDAFDSSLLSAWDLSFSVVWNRDLRKLCNFLSYRKMLVESYLNHTSFWSFRQMTLWRLWTKWRYGVTLWRHLVHKRAMIAGAKKRNWISIQDMWMDIGSGHIRIISQRQQNWERELGSRKNEMIGISSVGEELRREGFIPNQIIPEIVCVSCRTTVNPEQQTFMNHLTRHH